MSMMMNTKMVMIIIIIISIVVVFIVIYIFITIAIVAVIVVVAIIVVVAVIIVAFVIIIAIVVGGVSVVVIAFVIVKLNNTVYNMDVANVQNRTFFDALFNIIVTRILVGSWLAHDIVFELFFLICHYYYITRSFQRSFTFFIFV